MLFRAGYVGIRRDRTNKTFFRSEKTLRTWSTASVRTMTVAKYKNLTEILDETKPCS